ncbi:N-6 DNA methylase [Mesorhizobium sp.]|uniref:Eco57I restriction-modification methylase domain-containing protein n=1 Tax=Mesorhizobium sp. TaxID=1871066 RepID=UPI001201A3D9|nr:N-6 DNA methylase [Mesorhizobium sp.]TIS88441.1 MAG: SAM-dependent methyltransferase [Mesorhizobium sp.]
MSAARSVAIKASKARTHSGRFTNLEADKLRGGYYTSSQLADWLCSWAIRKGSDRVLEPSCGNGAFVAAAVRRLSEIGADADAISGQLRGIEIVGDEAAAARKLLRGAVGARAAEIVETGDFFAWWNSQPQPGFDAVVGNPPFIRYQTFPEPHRSRAMAIMESLGLTPNRLTNIWVPFVAAAAASLRPDGRMAFVLPAELLQVTYAAQLRSFLNDRFARIDIVACNELFFENAEQEVVLLLADGALARPSENNVCRMALTEMATVAEIVRQSPESLVSKAEHKTLRHENEKWLKYFLTTKEIEFMRALRASDVVTSLATHASIDVGVVTGKNEFFVLSGEQVRDLELERYTIPLVSRSAQLKGARVDRKDWSALAAAGDRVHLLDLKPLNGSRLTDALARYIRLGESKDVHTGYKCSIRTPWYAVPSIWTPDAFAFRQIYDFPRMVLNEAGATSTDTIHRLRSRGPKPERLIANTYTWLTAASAEIEGRSYGGGVLELEPTEAERLLVPAKLNGAMPLAESDRLTRKGRLDDVLEENARVVLQGHLGLSKRDCQTLQTIWTKMRDRRMARRRRGKSTAADRAS